MKNTDEIKLRDIDWNFNNPHKSILMHHFEYLELIWLDELLEYVLDGKLNNSFKRPNLYSGQEGMVLEYRFGKKQKQEIIKCLKHFFPNKICLIALNSEDKWYEKKDLIKYE